MERWEYAVHYPRIVSYVLYGNNRLRGGDTSVQYDKVQERYAGHHVSTRLYVMECNASITCEYRNNSARIYTPRSMCSIRYYILQPTRIYPQDILSRIRNVIQVMLSTLCVCYCMKKSRYDSTLHQGMHSTALEVYV